MNFKGIKKILVIKLRHIGDVLLTIPVFRALKESFPNVHIAALLNSGTEDVLVGNSLIDEIIIFDRNIKKRDIFTKYLKEISFLRLIRAKNFDMIIDLTSNDRGAIISFFSGARYRLAYDPKGKGLIGKRHLYTHLAKNRGGQHTVLKNLELVRQFGIDTKDLTLDFFIPQDAEIFVRRTFSEYGISTSDKVVHIHPTSRWLFKCWKDEYFAEVIKWLINKGVKIVITSSSETKEIDKVAQILSLIPSNRVLNLCGKISIKQLAAISKASSLFLGIDTAPMHIAAAVGTPVIALFGAGAKNWSPWGEGHVVISKDTNRRNGLDREEYISKNLAEIKPEEVIQALKDKLFK